MRGKAAVAGEGMPFGKGSPSPVPPSPRKLLFWSVRGERAGGGCPGRVGLPEFSPYYRRLRRASRVRRVPVCGVVVCWNAVRMGLGTGAAEERLGQACHWEKFFVWGEGCLDAVRADPSLYKRRESRGQDGAQGDVVAGTGIAGKSEDNRGRMDGPSLRERRQGRSGSPQGIRQSG